MDKKMKLAFACLALLILTATLAYAYQFSMSISWMLFSTFTVYFIESSLLFVFFIGGSCLISYSMYRLFKKNQERR